MEPIIFYIGELAVTLEIRDDQNGIVTYKLGEGAKEVVVTTEQYDSMVSQTAYPDGQISIRKWKPTIKKVLEILLSSGMEMVDKDFIIQQVDNSLIENYNRAVAKLFGVDHPYHIKVAHIDEVLKMGAEAKVSTTGSETDGVGA